MKPPYVPLRKLNDKTKDYKVKIKVIQKAQPMQSPQKNRYQRMILKDDEGTTMRATLFNDDIESFEEALQRNGEYEVSGATIQSVPPQYQSYTGEYQMNFNDRTKITPVNTRACSEAPNYMKLASIAETCHDKDELLDVVAVIIAVDAIQSITKSDKDQQVCHITIVDDSVRRPMKLSAWNTYATRANELVSSPTHGFAVVGFVGLKKATYRGMSLTTTMSTSFNLHPEGTMADTLRHWVEENSTTLTDWSTKVQLLKDSSSKKIITPVAEIEKKKASTVWQDDTFWINVSLPSIYTKDLYCYLGCSKCGRRAQAPANTTFKCGHCNASDATSTPRVSFSFYATDGTGALRLTAFGEEVEKIMDATSLDIHNLKNSENPTALEEKIAFVENKQVILQIGPTAALSTSYVLKWVVRSVEQAPAIKVEKED